MDEKTWKFFWAWCFHNAARLVDEARDLTEAYGYPAMSIEHPLGIVVIEHRSGDICKVYWPGKTVGRLWYEQADQSFCINPDGSYGWTLEPEQHFEAVVDSVWYMLDWLTNETKTED